MIKKFLKQNKTVYHFLVNAIEGVLQAKERMIWNFWKKYPRIGLRIANLTSTKMIPVLYMHWFVTRKEKNEIEKYSSSRWYSAIEDFEEQILWLKKNNYTFLSADEFYEWYRGEKAVPRKSVLLTFDDGEESNYQLVLPIVKKYNTPVLFFLVGKYLGEETGVVSPGAFEDAVVHFGKKEFKELQKESLVTIGSHTYNLHYMHDGKKAADLADDKTLVDDFEQISKNYDMAYFAAPYGAYNDLLYKNIKQHHKMGFCVETPKCPYARRGEDIFKIRRIRVDGLTTLNDFERLL